MWTQLRSSVFLSDEELGKKDDDHQLAGTAMLRSSHWQPATTTHSRRLLKRIAVLFLAAIGLWLVSRDILLDLGYGDHRKSRYSYSGLSGSGDTAPYTQHGPAVGNIKTSDTAAAKPAPRVPDHSFNGPIKFHDLAVSLHAIPKLRGSLPVNKNILFMAANLKTASILLPMACEMGRERRNYVHFALLSRDMIDMDDLQQINGIDDSCEIFFHDARPDFVSTSSDTRLQYATARALFHINTYMHPQVIIIDSTEQQEPWFKKGAKLQGDFMGTPVIELPDNAAKRLGWLTKLDSSSLAAWHKISIDILIHAPPTGSGSLGRLLKSLHVADFTAGTMPHLTIELPQVVEKATQRTLQAFRWPPARTAHTYGNAQMLSLRHRIPRERLTEEESSVRFLESFWPRSAEHSHVLVLSPQVEVTPQFFHYLKFMLLEYRYSRIALSQQWDRQIIGFSMVVPQAFINGTLGFEEPDTLDPDQQERKGGGFLWQAPHSDAVLFMGDKWVELHRFVSQTLERQHDASPPAVLSHKEVSKQYPSWLEHVLRLSQARGYLTVYPGAETASVMATVHKDLSQPPEEYWKGVAADETPKEGLVTLDNDIPVSPLVGILDTLPGRSAFLEYVEMPMLAWRGAVSDLQEVDRSAREYAAIWRQKVGKCDPKSEEAAEQLMGRQKDLFCEGADKVE
ncbi:hypothetical protein HYQ45_010815 [Verticillium longisporum]|uniref:Uncharacterized protein n=1 Tax=Verticillium longisporum TaxID=100787 RepID=A0A8I2ZFG4_VERLO|nr:hypothetical protein HYQ45_010815 [Verticillium longisporum]